jgi:hypothetical protein
MKKLLAIAASALLLFAMPMSAQEQLAITIATGSEGKGYDKDSRNRAESLRQSGFQVTIDNMAGSDQITKALCNNTHNMGWSQLDAVWLRSMEGCDLTAVGVYGYEGVFLLFPPGSPNDSLSDLDETDTVLVGEIGTGAHITFGTMKKIEKGDDGSNDAWANAQVLAQPYTVSSAAAMNKKISAVLMVRKGGAADLVGLISKGWTFGYLYDKDLDDLMVGDSPLYMSEKFCINNGERAETCNWIYAVSSGIFVNSSITNNDTLFFKIAANFN